MNDIIQKYIYDMIVYLKVYFEYENIFLNYIIQNMFMNYTIQNFVI